MADQFNPFHHWLGFDEKLAQPNHFQLFGVKPNSDDPIGFRKNIHARAKSMLTKLEEMSEEEIGQRQNLHLKLRRHIVKAHEILLDDKLRAAYLKGLRQKAREAKGSSKPLAVPPPQKSSAAAKAEQQDSAASQTGKHEDMTIKKGATPTVKQSADGGSPEESAVPMAIPISRPPEHEVSDPSASGKEVSFDNLQSEEIVITPGRIKRKRSWLIPILLTIMTLFCVAGIGALVTNFGNRFGASDPPAKNEAPVVPNEDPEAKKEKPVDPPTPEEIRKATEDLVNEKSEEPARKKTLEAVMVEDSEAEPEQPKPDPPKTITLNVPQLHTVNFYLDRARKEMKRGRLESAAQMYQSAEALFDGGIPGNDQAVIADEIKNGRGMIRHLEGFWEQVKFSSKKITGGELEPEPGTVIGFVEGRDDDVVLRFGENVAIPYRSLRPGLAMLLASKKGAPNLPAWRLQEAAYRLIQSQGSAESETTIEELITASEADEYDGSAIRGFRDIDLSGTFPEPTMTTVDKETMKSIAAELSAERYDSISRLDPSEANKHAAEMLSANYDDPVRRIVALKECNKLSQQAGDAFQMIDVIDEMHRWTETDTGNVKADGFMLLASKLPDISDPRDVGNAFYEFLTSADATALEPARLRRLKQRMLKFVSENGLDDLRRLISQTMD